MPDTIGQLFVDPSGRSIVAVIHDGSGNPSNVLDLLPTDNTQQLMLSGFPAGNVFALTFNGQTTAPIAVTSAAPLNYGLLTITTVASVAYQLWATWPAGFGFLSTGQLHEVFDSDGVTLLPGGSVTFDMTTGPTGITDGVKLDGNPALWQSIGTFTPTGTTLTVRVTAPSGQTLLVDGFRVEDVATSAVTYYDDAASEFTMTAADSSNSATDDTSPTSHWYDHTYSDANGSGVGPRHAVDPAAIQSALEALSSVGSGNVLVTAGDSYHDGPYTIAFRGALGGAAQPAITASDGAVGITIRNAGGVYPTYRVNGGSPINLTSPVWGVGWPFGIDVLPPRYAPYIPYVMWTLPQAAQATQLALAMSGAFGYTVALAYGEPGHANPTALMQGGAVGTFTFTWLPAGTYQVSVTWPATAGQASSSYLVKNAAGTTLATVSVDQTVAPTDFTADGVGWKVLGTFAVAAGDSLLVVSNADPMTLDTARLDRTSSDYSVVIGPDDFVTLSTVDGWATTLNNALAGVTDLAATNLVGGTLLPAFDPSAVTMPVGFNTGIGVNPFQSALYYSNVAKGIQWGGGTAAADSNGYPTVLSSRTLNVSVCIPQNDAGGTGKGLDGVPAGHWTFMWDGDNTSTTVTPFAYPDSTASPFSSNLTGGADNTLVYDFQPGPSTLQPSISFMLASTASEAPYTVSFTNLRIYPPGTDISDPPLFHASLLSRLAGARSLRFMDNLSTISGNVVEYSDLLSPSAISYFDQQVRTTPLASIAPYTGVPSGFDAGTFVVMQVTTTVPHNLITGHFVYFDDMFTQVQLSDSTAQDLQGAFAIIQVLSPTEFLYSTFGKFEDNDPPRYMTNMIIGEGTINLLVGNSGMCFEDMPKLCNAVGADFFLNAGALWSDDCCATVADYVAANLAPGLKCRVEYSNEVWNVDVAPFAQMNLLSVLVNDQGYNYPPPYYAYRMKQVHAIFATAFTNAGRAGDFVRIMGGQGGAPDFTKGIAAACAAISAPVDEVCVATYLDNASVVCNQELSLVPTYNLMTTDQDCDLMELNVLYGGTETYISNQRAGLALNGYGSVPIINYEGGPDVGCPLSVTANFRQRSRHVVRHPRYYGIMLAFLKRLQDVGCTLFNLYYYNGLGIGGDEWSCYYGWDMQPGTGDPTADAINISDPEALDQIKSEVGGAMLAWAAAVPGGGPAAATPALAAAGRPGVVALAVARSATLAAAGRPGVVALAVARSATLAAAGRPGAMAFGHGRVPSAPAYGPVAGGYPGGYWLYAPAAGGYLLGFDPAGFLVARAAGLAAGGMVVDAPEAGLYAVTLIVRRAGPTDAYLTPYPPAG